MTKLTRLLIVLSSMLLLAACGGGDFVEDFESAAEYNLEDGSGVVRDGRFFLTEFERESGVWVPADGGTFADGTYTLEVEQVSGPEDAGYGMIFRLDQETNSFYSFEVSTDGFALVAWCGDACNEAEALAKEGWFPTELVETGLNVVHNLRVEARGSEFEFYVNDQLVARADDDRLIEGDMGVTVDTFDGGGAEVAFDNMTFTPYAEEE